MTTTTSAVRTGHRSAVFILRIVVVALTLATALIHARLGGLLFTLNAIGYLGLATAMVLPGPVARVRWLARLALIAFTAATIGGWVLFGARFPLAYLDKAVELVLLVFLTFEVWLDGGPAEVVRRLRRIAEVTRNIRTGA
jgi:hypothetical protein